MLRGVHLFQYLKFVPRGPCFSKNLDRGGPNLGGSKFVVTVAPPGGNVISVGRRGSGSGATA